MRRRVRQSDSSQFVIQQKLLEHYDLGTDSDEYVERVKKLPVQPNLVIVDREIIAEIARIASEYLRFRFVKKLQDAKDNDSDGTKEDIDSQQELLQDNKGVKDHHHHHDFNVPNLHEIVPHPQTQLGLTLVGNAYTSLKSTQVTSEYILKLKQQDNPIIHEGFTHIYNTFQIAIRVFKQLDKEITNYNQNIDRAESCCEGFLGDIIIYADQGRRPTMEDKHVIIPNINAAFGLNNQDFGNQAYFAIFDGHGGSGAATYAKDHLHVNIVNHPLFEENLEKAIIEGFKITDEGFLVKAEREELTSGCTCVIMFIRDNKVYVAWLGDSSIMICRNNVPLVGICDPHKPERKDEKKRIEDAGGIVIHYGVWRVNGMLSVARAIGDKALKEYIVSDADCTITELNGSESFACLACDGLWDVMDPPSVVSFIKEYFTNDIESCNPISGIAKALVKHAFKLGSMDNISVVIVFFVKEGKSCILSDVSSYDNSNGGVDSVYDSLDQVRLDDEKT